MLTAGPSNMPAVHVLQGDMSLRAHVPVSLLWLASYMAAQARAASSAEGALRIGLPGVMRQMLHKLRLCQRQPGRQSGRQAGGRACAYHSL
jgi:hypothetical protein